MKAAVELEQGDRVVAAAQLRVILEHGKDAIDAIGRCALGNMSGGLALDGCPDFVDILHVPLCEGPDGRATARKGVE